MAHAGVEQVDALYISNMLSDELQCQKHIAALVTDKAGANQVANASVALMQSVGSVATTFITHIFGV
jgi:hypothetical protein